MSNVIWHGDAFRRALEAEQDKRVARAAMVVERQAKRLLSVSGTGVRLKTGQVIRKVKGQKGPTVYGAFPSRPGEPPRKQTGRLRASVTWEKVRTGVARVGTNVKYGRLLEVFVGPRPWLVRALKETSSQVKAILSAPWRWRA